MEEVARDTGGAAMPRPGGLRSGSRIACVVNSGKLVTTQSDNNRRPKMYSFLEHSVRRSNKLRGFELFPTWLLSS